MRENRSSSRRSWLISTIPECAGQLALQPFDAGEVEVVGRLVEQQDVGQRSQHPGQRGAACLSAGQRPEIFLAGKAEFLEQIEGPVSIGSASVEPGLDIG